jgi:hypothetical protein
MTRTIERMAEDVDSSYWTGNGVFVDGSKMLRMKMCDDKRFARWMAFMESACIAKSKGYIEDIIVECTESIARVHYHYRTTVFTTKAKMAIAEDEVRACLDDLLLRYPGCITVRPPPMDCVDSVYDIPWKKVIMGVECDLGQVEILQW